MRNMGESLGAERSKASFINCEASIIHDVSSRQRMTPSLIIIIINYRDEAEVINKSVDWLTDWLIDWLIDWLVTSRLIDWLLNGSSIGEDH